MKNKIVYLIMISLTGLFSACEENNDGYYDNIPRIYFPEETDSLNYSYGDKVPELTRHTILVPVRMMGEKATREMKFKISLDKEQSTAEESVHFTKLASEYSLLVDSINAYLPVELIRDNLSEEEVIYKIVFKIEPSSDFQIGSKENLRAVITFNNFLEEPEWWSNVFGAYTLNYHRGMYQRLIAYYGHPLEQDYCFNNYLKVMTVFKREVYDYWKQHPELTEWQFQDEEYMWWPYN